MPSCCAIRCVPQLCCTTNLCPSLPGGATHPHPPTAAAEGGEAAAAGAGEPKSFYLQEMERYRSATCETSGGGDRPLVK